MKITTKEELLQHIEAHKGKNVPLFAGYRGHGFVLDESIKSHYKIEVKEYKGEKDRFFIHLDDEAYHSLMDRHLGKPQTYNDTWWFTTQEEAEAFIES